MAGKFVLQKLYSLPIFNSNKDEGRIVYDSNKEKVYFGGSNRWKSIGSDLGDLTTEFTSGGVLHTGYAYRMDTSSAALSGFLTTEAVSGDIITILDDKSSFSLNNFTIDASGGTINGFNNISLDVDDTIASLMYTGEEWKIDIGGLSTSTGSTSGSLNFNSIDTINNISDNDNFVVQDQTDGLNKKISLSNILSSMNIDSSLTELESPSYDDYYIIYDTSENTTKKITPLEELVSVKISANEMSLDDTNTSSSRSDVLNIYECINFLTIDDGSCGFGFHFPISWNVNENIKMKIYYSMDGNDPGKTVRLVTDFGSVSNGDQPDYNNSDQTINNDITSTTDNIGKYAEIDLNDINNTNIESGILSSVIKLTRDVSQDNYSGDFQLISVKLYQ